MELKVEDERVRRNVLFFLHLLSILETSDHLDTKSYPAYLNVINGEILFPRLLAESKALQTQEWKPIAIAAAYLPGEDPHFKISNPISKVELAPLASRVIEGTLRVLNQASTVMRKTVTIQKSLAELARLHLQKALSEMENCPLRKLSRPLSRWQAEEILNRHPYGSFLFRKDEYAAILEKQLEAVHHFPIFCYTLSFSMPEHKIMDLTLVQKKENFILYDDDPSLSGNTYASLCDLIEHLSEVCKYPLF